ncbi:MAG TPA: hypothetical protein VLC93_00060 [Myxococcota bacterium]|nr:hypothetical protein [Myxococcota bacterium]
MSDKLYDAARRLLERLDTLKAFEEHTMELAIYKAIREIAAASGVSQATLWSEACKVEPDPVERHRGIIGRNWRPALR